MAIVPAPPFSLALTFARRAAEMLLWRQRLVISATRALRGHMRAYAGM